MYRRPAPWMTSSDKNTGNKCDDWSRRVLASVCLKGMHQAMLQFLFFLFACTYVYLMHPDLLTQQKKAPPTHLL